MIRKRLLLLPIFLFVCWILSAQPRYENRFVRPLDEVLGELEQRFSVRIECRRFSADTMELPYASFRIRPYSLEESLQGVCAPLDLKWSRRSNGKYRVEPYEYYRRTPADGERLLQWLSDHYASREEWELRRDSLLDDVQHFLRVDSLRSLLVADPQVQWGEERLFAGYTTRNFRLETLPGVFVGGTIYAPAAESASDSMTSAPLLRPFILSPAGHWPQGRLREDQQYRMATFARMGAVAVDLDIVGRGSTAASVPFSHEDPRSNALQLLWSLAVTDWMVAVRQDIDTTRMAATGGSGGATHCLLLALSDARFRVLAPVVHLVSHFDGGCPCESALPITLAGGGSCTTELLAAAMAPDPVLVVSDGGDWTATYPTMEYPFLQRIWSFYGAEEQVENVHFAEERHDYGPRKREAVYRFFARHLGLDLQQVDERCVTLQRPEALEAVSE